MEDAQRTIPWSDKPAEKGYWLKEDFPLWNSVRSSAKLGRPFMRMGSELSGEAVQPGFKSHLQLLIYLVIY